ncbi:MAG: FeoB-associated Cys-rich membrane protein [Bacteroidales bacterium]|nr:FeoB-associated Cys-rich membrane protein [Bacteroidales bacterium]
MTQDSLVIILVVVATIFAMWKIYRKFRPKSEEVCETNPSGCTGCGEDCPLKEVKHGK